MRSSLAPGTLGAFLAFEVVEGCLVGISARDLLPYTVSGILLILSSMLAAWISARRLYRARSLEEFND